MADGEAADGRLGRQLVDRMDWLTDQRHGALALENARRNGAWLEHGHSLAALRQESLGAGDAALVIAAGPSIKRNDPAVTIRDQGFAGAVVATESASYRPAAHVAHSPSRGPRSHSAAAQHSHVIRDSCELHSCKMCYAASA